MVLYKKAHTHILSAANCNAFVAVNASTDDAKSAVCFL